MSAETQPEWKACARGERVLSSYVKPTRTQKGIAGIEELIAHLDVLDRSLTTVHDLADELDGIMTTLDLNLLNRNV